MEDPFDGDANRPRAAKIRLTLAFEKDGPVVSSKDVQVRDDLLPLLHILY
jgi:hypothetical protein